ncbi:hypothetical protein D3C83_163050 [compost metagenome]
MHDFLEHFTQARIGRIDDRGRVKLRRDFRGVVGFHDFRIRDRGRQVLRGLAGHRLRRR